MKNNILPNIVSLKIFGVDTHNILKYFYKILWIMINLFQPCEINYGERQVALFFTIYLK